jgi:sugar lactone lactonase YvrE
VPESLDQRATRIVAGGFAATECPRWHDGRLFFSDMHGKAVHVLDGDRARKLVDVPGTPGGLGWLPDGSMLVVAQNERALYRLASDNLTRYADLSASGSSPLNDMWVAQSGRAYVGEMGFDVHAFLEAAQQERTDGPAFAFGRVLVVDTDGSHRPAGEADLMFPNGMVPGAEPDELLVAESFGFKITAFHVAADGSLTEPRLWAQLDFAPDGIALDADGHLWVADPAGKRAVLLAQGGSVLDAVPTTDTCLAVALGGATGDDLYLCTTPDTDPHRSVALAGSHVEVVSLSRTD